MEYNRVWLDRQDYKIGSRLHVRGFHCTSGVPRHLSVREVVFFRWINSGRRIFLGFENSVLCCCPLVWSVLHFFLLHVTVGIDVNYAMP